MKIRVESPPEDRGWILLLVNAVAAYVAPFLPLDTSGAIAFLVVMLIVSLVGTYQVRIDSDATSARWPARAHLLPSFVRDQNSFAWRLVFRMLLVATVLLDIGSILVFPWWYFVIVGVISPAIILAIALSLLWVSSKTSQGTNGQT
jgi:hypothetical protein